MRDIAPTQCSEVRSEYWAWLISITIAVIRGLLSTDHILMQTFWMQWYSTYCPKADNSCLGVLLKARGDHTVMSCPDVSHAHPPAFMLLPMGLWGSRDSERVSFMVGPPDLQHPKSLIERSKVWARGAEESKMILILRESQRKKESWKEVSNKK